MRPATSPQQASTCKVVHRFDGQRKEFESLWKESTDVTRKKQTAIRCPTPDGSVPNKTVLPGGTPRGSVTTIQRNSSPTTVVTENFKYDDLGNIVGRIDGLGHETLTSCGENFTEGITR
jgi:hypothetical protein